MCEELEIRPRLGREAGKICEPYVRSIRGIEHLGHRPFPGRQVCEQRRASVALIRTEEPGEAVTVPADRAVRGIVAQDVVAGERPEFIAAHELCQDREIALQ